MAAARAIRSFCSRLSFVPTCQRGTISRWARNAGSGFKGSRDCPSPGTRFRVREAAAMRSRRPGQRSNSAVRSPSQASTPSRPAPEEPASRQRFGASAGLPGADIPEGRRAPTGQASRKPSPEAAPFPRGGIGGTPRPSPRSAGAPPSPRRDGRGSPRSPGRVRRSAPTRPRGRMRSASRRWRWSR